MKVVICASIHFTAKIKEIADKLITLGHEVEIPLTAQEIIKGNLSLEEFKLEKEKTGDGSFRKIDQNLIKRYYNIIKEADSVLVINIEKNEIKNYIGGNTLIEMAFAHVLCKPVYLLNDIPNMSYTDEIKAMLPIVINHDLRLIK